MSSTEQAGPCGSPLTEELGPLPERAVLAQRFRALRNDFYALDQRGPVEQWMRQAIALISAHAARSFAAEEALAAERERVLAAVEQRIRGWRQRTMNKSGDRLALDDFMGQDSIDDLIDCVCDEWA
jgi:hypothetical protein